MRNDICCSAQELQIWEIISREILNLSLNAKFYISKNMALFLYYLGKKFIALLTKGRFMDKIIQLTCP